MGFCGIERVRVLEVGLTLTLVLAFVLVGASYETESRSVSK
jgi:hypothetical protein